MKLLDDMTEMPDYTAIGPTTLINEDENIQKDSDQVNVANKVEAPEASDENLADPAPETTGLLLEQQRLLQVDFQERLEKELIEQHAQ